MDERREYPLEEREYVMPPHPEAVVAKEVRPPPLEPPTSAEHTLADLVKQAVDGLRGELMMELRTEMRIELQKEIRGIEFNVENQELSVSGRA